ncbi:MAG: carbamoyltransferase [Deltaproteobacteria bacterium]|nr:carbamoyltransferase [Deltaproteobacteria bacterium]
MNVIGISAYYHEASCCLLKDGELVAAAEEERFSRKKHDPRLPVAAFRYCLEEGGLSVADVNAVGYYESPTKKLSRQIWAGKTPETPAGLTWLESGRPEREIRELLGFEGPIHTFEHHLSHAASSFFYSGYESAAILTVDGVGEWATTTYGRGDGSNLELFEEVRFPHSIGLLYSTITGYLGFRVNGGEYKVMGLAPYGTPRYVDQIWQMISSREGGQYELNLEYFDFLQGAKMYSPAIADLFGQPPRVRESEMTQFHKDVARSLQVVLEELLLEKVRYLHSRVGGENLCMAGGVALNCVANGRVLRDGPFERLFVQPAAGDAGACMGAAALAHRALTGKRPSEKAQQDSCLGPRFESDGIAHLLEATGLEALDFRGREAELLETVVDRLVGGKVVGWFHGRMEFGPRALGARSILADPRDAGMRDRLNALVKKREAFRPFAPSILEERASEHLDLDHPSPFMLETCQVISPIDLPAITHVDRSARPQTVNRKASPRYAALIEAFERRTGCPILVNTSFNVRSEPIVCTPVDALCCMVSSDIECLVLEDFVIDRDRLPPHLPAAVADLYAQQGSPGGRVTETVYTFV